MAFKRQSNIYSVYDYKALMIKIMLQMFMWELSNAEKVQKEAEKLKINWKLTRRSFICKNLLCNYVFVRMC